MTGISWAGDTVTVLRATVTTTQRGDAVLDWSSAAEIPLTGCRWQPRTGDEITPGGGGATRDAVIDGLTLFAPLDADLHALDRMLVDGVTWEVDGPPRRWRGPTGALAHTEATLRRVDG